VRRNDRKEVQRRLKKTQMGPQRPTKIQPFNHNRKRRKTLKSGWEEGKESGRGAREKFNWIKYQLNQEEEWVLFGGNEGV